VVGIKQNRGGRGGGGGRGHTRTVRSNKTATKTLAKNHG
jgi:hypothetical protein